MTRINWDDYTTEEILEAARTMPVVLGPWLEVFPGTRWVRLVQVGDADLRPAVVVADGETFSAMLGYDVGVCADIESAKALADAEAVKRGWRLL